MQEIYRRCSEPHRQQQLFGTMNFKGRALVNLKGKNRMYFKGKKVMKWKRKKKIRKCGNIGQGKFQLFEQQQQVKDGTRSGTQ